MTRPDRPFIDAILAAPDDDAPRLIYADWLQEHGDEARAEFIRVQCELHQIAPLGIAIPGHMIVRFETLRRREQELLPLLPDDGMRFDVTMIPVWRRGFLEEITCAAADCIAHLDAIREEHPIREVRLTTRPIYGTLTVGENEIVANLVGRRPHTIFKGPAIGVRIDATTDMDTAILSLEWPGITFHLPEFGPSPLRAAYPAYRQSQDLMNARR